jgi:dTDP-glucose 4,6-dehydratase
MKLLITGGAGFIGSNFIYYWIEKYPNDFLVNLDKLTYAGNLDNLKDVANNKNYKFVRGDICDKELVNNLVKDVDVVVHFAAESHNDRVNINPMEALRTNIIGTEVLLDAALNNGKKRFHHISTDEVFGHLESKEGFFNEDTPYNPRSFYPASKASADFWVRAYFNTKGLPVTISNCSNNFGCYQHPEKIIPLFATNLIENKKVPIYGDGSNIRDWLYVKDHCCAIDLILQKGRIGETYNIGANSEVSNLDLTKKILKILGRGEDMIERVKDRPGHDWRYAIDSSKIRNELGWEPRFSFDEALKETVFWYKENEWWWKRLKDEEFEEYCKRNYKPIQL